MGPTMGPIGGGGGGGGARSAQLLSAQLRLGPHEARAAARALDRGALAPLTWLELGLGFGLGLASPQPVTKTQARCGRWARLERLICRGWLGLGAA
jgi:hypothetical protein